MSENEMSEEQLETNTKIISGLVVKHFPNRNFFFITWDDMDGADFDEYSVVFAGNAHKEELLTLLLGFCAKQNEEPPDNDYVHKRRN